MDFYFFEIFSIKSFNDSENFRDEMACEICFITYNFIKRTYTVL